MDLERANVYKSTLSVLKQCILMDLNTKYKTQSVRWKYNRKSNKVHLCPACMLIKDVVEIKRLGALIFITRLKRTYSVSCSYFHSSQKEAV